MAERPTPGGSDGTYGTELNAHLDVSLASDGKVKDGAVFSTSATPTVDAGVANKLYTDEATLNPGTVKGWVKFDGSDASIKASHNVSGVVRSSEGTYVVSWDTDFADDTYAVVVSSNKSTVRLGTQAAGTIQVITTDSTFAVSDATIVCVMAIGAQ